MLVCGVCRTDVHGMRRRRARGPDPPLVPGHQIVGVVEAVGDGVEDVAIGPIEVGVPWLGSACGECRYCTTGRQNLCERALFTGYQLDGGYAERVVADARACLPSRTPSPTCRPRRSCARGRRYRALRMTGDANRLGLYGFGGAAHIVTQNRESPRGVGCSHSPVPGDTTTQAFARELGATWAGSSTEAPPEPLMSQILFAAAGELVPRALDAVEAGGTVVCARRST